jgi:hypothetical protein
VRLPAQVEEVMTIDDAPLLIRHSEAQRLLGIGPSNYFKMVRAGTIRVVGKGRQSRALYSSVREYVQRLVAEAEAQGRKAA